MSAKARRFETRLTVSLTGRDYDALNALADRDDVSASWLVRRAVEEYLRQRRHEIEVANLTQAPEEKRSVRSQVRHTHRGEAEC
jgi:metal-responsive CopG/Arc/MetJ family transcriptional regulator